MSVPGESAPAPSEATGEIERIVVLQRAAFAAERFPSLAVRRDRLVRVLRLALDHEEAIAAAIDADFGGRARQETKLAETYLVASGAREAMRHLSRWMTPRRVGVSLALFPGYGTILPQPLGVVGVVSPWNYPFQLAMAPALGALAAGNRVVVKPSELTPRTSALIHELVTRHFREDEFAVVLGDATVGRAFTAQKWDHLFFTGSTAVGRRVARAAAENLVPCTLELGGKSPALFDEDADFALCVPRLVAGKLFNAGQTCIAPDYALVPAARRDEFLAAVQAAIGRLYPDLAISRDYTAIVNDAHFMRLTGLVDDARAKGACVTTVNPGERALDPKKRTLPPTLLTNVRDEMAVMQQEIFGPLLPIETYSKLDEAIERIDARPRPLAFYFFGSDSSRTRRVLQQTIAGGVTLNDALLHFAHEELPFGGVGASGIGAYHGEHSFRLFSHQKAVFHQPRFSPAKLLWPPYRAAFDRVLALLKRLNA